MQLGTDSLQSILAITVDKALAKIQRHDSPLLVKERFLALEKERLVRLALAWLEHEKQRPDFEVLAVEQQNTTTVAGLPLKLRIDRIDRLPNGQYLIIDYKTGTVTQKDWQGDDLKEPQLPLYCLMDRDKVSGIAFAQVRLGSEKLKGMADESSASVLPEKDMDLEGQWDIQIDHWDQQLQRLAQDFFQGYAAVKPASGLAKKECEYCPYPNLCRVGESA